MRKIIRQNSLCEFRGKKPDDHMPICGYTLFYFCITGQSFGCHSPNLQNGNVMNKEFLRSKLLLPLCYICVVALAIISANSFIPHAQRAAEYAQASGFMGIEPAAGAEMTEGNNGAVPIPQVDESELKDAPIIDGVVAEAEEEPPLRISPDKPEIVHLDKDAVNVLVGSDETLRAVPDTNRTIILIPKKPGATFFKAIDADGKVIAQRHVIIAAPAGKSKYVRIRRACVNGADGCREYSVYYCPDMCHEVNVVQDEKTTPVPLPTDVSSTPDADNGDPNSENVAP